MLTYVKDYFLIREMRRAQRKKKVILTTMMMIPSMTRYVL